MMTLKCGIPSVALSLSALFFSFAGLALTSPPAQTAEAKGRLTVVVTNGTTGKAQAGVEVTLLAIIGDSIQEIGRLVSDENGQVLFNDLDASAPSQYALRAQYKGIKFFGNDTINFEGGDAQLALGISVYEPSEDDSQVSIDRYHQIYAFHSNGTMSIAELYIFSNDSIRAYVGRKDESGRLVSINFSLPKGAFKLQVQEAEEGVDYFKLKDGFASGLAIIPGEGSAQLVFTFDLPFEGKSASIDRVAMYAIKSANVLVPNQGERVNVEGFQPGEPRTIQDQEYIIHNSENLSAGKKISVSLDNLDSLRFDAQINQKITPLGQGKYDQRSLMWAILLLGLAAMILPITQPRWIKHWRGQNIETWQKEKSRLLLFLARLDDDFRAGEIHEEIYNRVRSQKIEELLAIMRRQEEESSQ